jgi:hypothetical protein
MTHVLMSEHNACAGEGSCPCQTSHVSNQTRARHCECAKKKKQLDVAVRLVRRTHRTGAFAIQAVLPSCGGHGAGAD